jgi:hypothetical protein
VVIKPEAIPQFTGDVDAIEKHAGVLRTVGGGFRDIGVDTHATWQGLSAFYEAPEAGRLFAATAPIKSSADAFGGQVESVGSALSQYAAAVRPIAARLKVLQSEAVCFVGMVNADEDWRSDEGNVNRNNDLIRQVDAQVAALMAAERAAANQINQLYGGTQWSVDDGSGQAGMYGFNAGDVPADAERPWGASAEVDEPWYVDTWNAVWSAGKGVVVDGLWGTVTGIWGLVNPFDWDTFTSSWGGLWTLTGNVFFDPGETGRAWKELGKGFIAWDEWEKDPARAVGLVAFNVLTLPVAWLKVSKAGQAGKVGGVLDKAGDAAKVGRFDDLADAGRLAGILRLDKIGLPTVGDLAKQIDGTFKDILARDPGLDAALRNADNLAAHAETPNVRGDDIVGSADEARNARQPERVGVGGREADSVTDGGRSGGGDGTRSDLPPHSDAGGPETPAGSHGDDGPPRGGPPEDGGGRPGATEGAAYRPPDPGTPEYAHRQQELAQDPAHGGKPTPKGLREAEVGLEMERRGELPGPIRRAEMDNSDPAFQKDQGEFVDATGQTWDVKAPADLFPAGPKAGTPMPPGLRGRYDGDIMEGVLARELTAGQNVIIDTKNLSPAAATDLARRVAGHSEWAGRVKFL